MPNNDISKHPFKCIQKCTCPLCGMRMDGLSVATDVYFDMYNIITESENPTFSMLPIDIKDSVLKVMNLFRRVPRKPFKIGQRELVSSVSNRYQWEYMVKDLQIEIAMVLMRWVVKYPNVISMPYNSEAFRSEWNKQISGGNRQAGVLIGVTENANTENANTIDERKFQELLNENLSKEQRREQLNNYISVGKTINKLIAENRENIKVSAVTRDFESKIIQDIYDTGSEEIDGLFNSNGSDRFLFRSEIILRSGEGNDQQAIIADLGSSVGNSEAGGRHCPNCNFRLSQYAGAFREVVLTTLGYPRVSKSTTIASNIFFLQQLGVKLHFDSKVMDGIHQKDDNEDVVGGKVLDWDEFEQRYYKHYTEGRAVEATNAQEADIPRFSLWIEPPLPGESIVLTIIDIPGEFVKSEKWSEAKGIYSKIYEATDYLWYCTEISETQNLDRFDFHQKEQIFNNQGKFEIDYSGGAPKRTSTRKIEFDEIRKLWNNNGSPMFSLAQKDGIKAMIVLGKTDFVDTQEFFNLFGADRDYREYRLFQHDYYMNADRKHFGITKDYIWVDEHEMFERMNLWRKYFCDHQFGEIIARFDNLFRGEGGYCAMSAYGREPRHIPNIDIKKYEDALMEYSDYLYNNSNELHKKTEDQFLAERNMSYSEYRRLQETRSIQKPDPYMGGWPILWLLACEKIVRLKNVIHVRESKLFGLSSKDKVETRYFTISNEKSRRNILMSTDGNQNNATTFKFRSHSADE